MTVNAIQDGIGYVGIIIKIGPRSVLLDFTRNVQSGTP